MPTPLPALAEPTPEVRRFAAEARDRLRNLAAAPFPARAGWLAELAEGITARLDGFAGGGLGPFWVRLLRELVAELSGQPVDPADLHHRWLRAQDVLDALAGDQEPGREPDKDHRHRPFWKR